MSSETATDLTEDRRRVVFEVLVAAQDEGFSVPNSREVVAGRYGLTVQAVRDIEEEGVAGNWLV